MSNIINCFFFFHNQKFEIILHKVINTYVYFIYVLFSVCTKDKKTLKFIIICIYELNQILRFTLIFNNLTKVYKFNITV